MTGQTEITLRLNDAVCIRQTCVGHIKITRLKDDFAVVDQVVAHQADMTCGLDRVVVGDAANVECARRRCTRSRGKTDDVVVDQRVGGHRCRLSALNHTGAGVAYIAGHITAVACAEDGAVVGERAAHGNGVGIQTLGTDRQHQLS